MGKLDGKVALVTGASGGIGEATARLLAAEGAIVAMAARRLEKVEKIAGSIREARGKASAYSVDVAQEESVNALVNSVVQDLGKLDILINNAGVMMKAPVETAKMEEWRYMVGINLLGTLYVTHAAVPHMVAAKSGHIINMSSTAGLFPRPVNSVYAATKASLVSFSEALRLEMADHNVRVSVLAPGLVKTELASHSTDPRGKALSADFSQIPQLTAEDIALTILFCLTLPEHVNVCEMIIRSVQQKF